MIILYKLGIQFYYLFIKIASIFNSKANLWIEGRIGIFEKIASEINLSEKKIWFHFASLGEFEQGRPVLEAVRENYPEHKIVMTFFSPSGYEVRKNYVGADYVFYLPLDTKSNSKKFIKLISPEIVFFTKYEYWHYYFEELKKNQIPLYIISAIFRKDQHFFKPWGEFYRKILKNASYFFVQDTNSQILLNSIGITNQILSGDTRFDRVYEAANNAKEITEIKEFCGTEKILIAGSTWLADEELISKIDLKKNNLKLIIAPHEVSESRIEEIVSKFNGEIILYSKLANLTNKDIKILLIDNVGMLSSIYQYATIAYIGGGFGVGIHNCLEAAAFGMPIFFGPNYQKFNEARELISLDLAKSIHLSESFNNDIENLLTDEYLYNTICEKTKEYVFLNKGATSKIISHIKNQ